MSASVASAALPPKYINDLNHKVDSINGIMLNHQFFFEPAEITLRRTYVSPEFLMSRLKGLIEQNYKDVRDPQFYSSALAYGLRSLNNICKEYTGSTVFMLVQERLALEAERLLLGTSLSTKQIAYELGFYDPAYFCRFFKKMRGLRPGEMRIRNCRFSTVMS